MADSMLGRDLLVDSSVGNDVCIREENLFPPVIPVIPVIPVMDPIDPMLPMPPTDSLLSSAELLESESFPWRLPPLLPPLLPLLGTLPML